MCNTLSIEPEIEARLSRIEQAIEDQKMFVHRVPDPDTREKADGHLLQLVEMRDRLRSARLQYIEVR